GVGERQGASGVIGAPRHWDTGERRSQAGSVDGGASKRRRLSLLVSVGWVPPYVHPSGACLHLGTRVPVGSLTAAEGYTTPGLRLFSCPLANLLNIVRTRTWSVKRSWGIGTSWY